MDELNKLRKENEDLKLILDDLKNELEENKDELENVKQECFFHSNELRQKLDEAEQEIEKLKKQLKKSNEKLLAQSIEDDEDSYVSIVSKESTQGSKSAIATNLELDRAKREVKSLKLELIYFKSKAKENNNDSTSVASSCCGSIASYSLLSTDFSSVSASLHNEELSNDKEHVIFEQHKEINRIQRQMTIIKMELEREKNKSSKEIEKLSQEIDDLQRINMFHCEEISKLCKECTCRDDARNQSKKKTKAMRKSEKRKIFAKIA